MDNIELIVINTIIKHNLLESLIKKFWNFLYGLEIGNYPKSTWWPKLTRKLRLSNPSHALTRIHDLLNYYMFSVASNIWNPILGNIYRWI